MKRSSGNPHDPAPGHSTQRGRRIACCQCRQAKIRCELSSGGDAPCSRCRRLGQDCEIDLGFKPVTKRARLEELENEVRQLRSSVPTVPSSADAAKLLDSPSGEDNRGINTRLSRPIQSSPGTESLIASSSAPSVSNGTILLSPASPRSLGNVLLKPSQISELFGIYFDHYNPFTLLLDPAVHPDVHFDRSNILFWVIIYTASRQFIDEPTLLTALTASIKRLMWQTISNPPYNWYLVQAISIFCLWPPPVSSISLDTTTVLINVAQTISMELGLHNPESIQDFSRTKRKLAPEEISEVVRTWSVCYIVSQSVHSTCGISVPAAEGMIDAICDKQSRYAIPLVLKHQLLTYRFATHVTTYMSKNTPRLPSSSVQQNNISALSLLEHELRDLSLSFGTEIPAEAEIALNSVELQIYVYYLLDNEYSLARNMGLVRAFDLSKAVIEKLQHIDQESHIIKYCPISYYRLITLAALFILRLCDSSLANHLDMDGGKRAFHSAMSFLRNVSVEDNDLPGKSSRIFSQLWTMQGTSQHSQQEPRLKLRTRLAASLLHDQIWTWRESFGGQKSAARTPSRDVFDDNPSGTSFEDIPTSVEEESINQFSFDDVFDAGMLSLLPYDLETNAFVETGSSYHNASSSEQCIVPPQ